MPSHRLKPTLFAVALLLPQASLAENTRVPITGLQDASIASRLPFDGSRASLAASGISYGLNTIAEAYSVIEGGIARGSAADGRAELYVDADLEKLLGCAGCVLHANGYYIFGEGPTSSKVENIFAVSNIEALQTVRLFELWFEKALVSNAWNLRLGLLAADSEFILSSSAAQLLNGTFGWPGIAASNMRHGGPAYPVAVPGIRMQVTPAENFSFLTAVFNGSPADPNSDDAQRDNRHGIQFRLADAPLLMAEGQFKYVAGLPGQIKLGSWRHFGDFDDPLTGGQIAGNRGLYVVVDQQLWRDGDRKSVSAFTRMSISPEGASLFDFYFDAGAAAYGLIASRPQDSITVGFGFGRISDRVRRADQQSGADIQHDFEAVLELNYQAHILPGWTISPDFQYIWHPGGHVADPSDGAGRRAVKDAAIIGVRTSLSY